MTELSPAAQAAQAAVDAWVAARRNQTRTSGRYEALAAAFRAVADQVTPDLVEPEYRPSGDPSLDMVHVAVWLIWYANNSVRTKLLAIGAELEGQPLPQSPTQPTTDNTP